MSAGGLLVKESKQIYCLVKMLSASIELVCFKAGNVGQDRRWRISCAISYASKGGHVYEPVSFASAEIKVHSRFKISASVCI